MLIENITRNIHALCKDLTGKLPFVHVIFYHTASERNPEDLCSTECIDPISAIESDLWRNGLPEMLDCNWPPASDIFLKVANGELEWVAQGRENSKCAKCHGTVCGPQNKPHCDCL